MDDLAQRIAKLSPQKRALLELQLLKKKGLPEPIAIVGIGCRFPGAPNLDAFWQLLKNGVDAITPIPRDRWDADSLYDQEAATVGKTYCREGGFLDQVDGFDPAFFGIAPREASFIDPQQRVFLEVVWQALEDAGIPAPDLSGSKTGVFVGISTNDYGQWLLSGPEAVGTYTTTGLASTMAANRLSYLLNLRGPSLAVDTACSSSLVAVHLACQSLRSGESEVAIAGGVNLILRPELTIGFSKLTALSPDGRCKAFDAAANGFVRSEGAGAVVLKPVSQAIRAGDPIYAVIRGSAVNQDGRSNGLTAPNREAQEAVIQAAFDQAGMATRSVSYFEAHGTGTLLGDPIEMKALGRVLGPPGEKPPIAIGSVKSNIGHTEAAAGIASLIKVALCIHHRTLVPSLHFQTPNPHIPFDQLPLTVQQRCEPWPDVKGERTAGVSAFAFGGTNAHAVVAAWPTLRATPSDPQRPCHLLPLSAKTPAALQAQASQMADWLTQTTATLADICHTLGQGRSHFPHRRAVFGETRQDMAAALRAAARPVTSPPKKSGPPVVFLFTGQGSQYVGMGQQLYETQPVFRAALDRCAEIAAPYLDCPLIQVLFEPVAPAPETSQLHQTAYTQPALFALEYALSALWQSWGIRPAAVLGHSIGEYVAACVAGILSLEDGLRLIIQRGRLMQSLAEAGTMAAIFADEAKVAAVLAKLETPVAIATLNGPANTVIAGTAQGIQAALAKFKAQGIRVHPLNVSHAFHSPMMAPILPAFGQMARQVQHHPAQIPVALNVTGKLLSPGETLDAAYWQHHARQPVRFAEGLQALMAEGFNCFLEIGPRPILCGMGRRCAPNADIRWLPTLQPGQSDWEGLLRALGKLYELGHAIDWQGFDQPYQRQRLSGLPTYPFQRQRYWIELPDQISAVRPTQPTSSLQDCLYEVAWEASPLSPAAAAATDRWLVFADQQRIGDALIEKLRTQDSPVTAVAKGAAFGASEEGCFTLDPAEPDTFEKLLAALSPPKSARQQVLYLWGIDQSQDSPQDLADAGAGLLHLVQAIAASGRESQWQLWIVTQNVQAVTSDGCPSPMQAPLWGLGSVVSLEHPEMWGGLIDLDEVIESPEGMAEALITHCLQDDAEDRVAFRRDQRWGARLRPLPVSDNVAPTMHREGTYLITGGLGALGLRVAQSLIRLGAKTLVLVSRRGERPEQDATLAALRRAGATVHIESVDVAEASAVSRLIKNIQETLPPLRGVVHAAGTLADGLLVGQTWQQFQTVMRAKIQGAWNLHRAIKANPLDFFMLFSSAASLLGSPGQGNYAAANAFLDALAHARRARGLAAQTLNWGPWQEAGLALEAAGTTERLEARGIGSFSPEQGIQLFERMLGQTWQLPAQVGVLRADWLTLQEQLPLERVPAFFSGVMAKVAEPAQSNFLKTLMALDEGDRALQLQRYLQSTVADILGRSDRVSATDNLLDMGLDSLMVMDLLGICKRELGLTLYPREVFEHPTLEKLSTYLVAELGDRLEMPAAEAVSGESATSATPMAEFSVPIWGRDRPFEPVAHKNPPAIFLLSSPRSGSTLLRVMLAGHPALFCPPELHLLPFETLSERQTALAGSYLDQGLQRAIMTLKALDADTSGALLQDWIAQRITVAEVYQKLQALAEGRYLVDKSPTYGFSRSTLARAEQLFDKPKYIYLSRHPLAVVDSFVRNRMHKILALPEQAPAELANQAWTHSNQTMLDFLATIDSTRYHSLRYEDLVSDPAAEMIKLCQFLDIPFHPSVLDPYEPSERRMTDGVSAQSLPIDDPNFHRRRAIDPTLANAWKTVTPTAPLSAAGQALAQRLGYELPSGAIAPSLPSQQPLASMGEQRLTVRGLDLCLCTWGPETGMPVLCIHGVLNQGAIWDAIAPALVQQGYRIIAPDLRGHGRSAHVGPEGNYQLLDHLADVDGIAQQLNLDSYHLVGHSMGAILAASLASARPAALRSLTLVEPVVPGAETNAPAAQLVAHLDYLAAPPAHPTYRSAAEAVERFQKTIPGLSQSWAEALAHRIVETTDSGWRWRWDPRLQVRTRFGLSGGTFTRDRYGQLLQTLQVPTILIFGQQSDFNRPEDLTFQRQHLPRANAVTIPGGHHLPLESPAAVAHALLGHIGRT